MSSYAFRFGFDFDWGFGFGFAFSGYLLRRLRLRFRARLAIGRDMTEARQKKWGRRGAVAFAGSGLCGWRRASAGSAIGPFEGVRS